MLFPAASQNSAKNMRSSTLPDGFEIQTLPHFAAEFLTGKQPRQLQIRTLELPGELSEAFTAPGVESASTRMADYHFTDTYYRAQKLRRFAQDCSWAIDHVYFGGEGVACNKQLLDAHGITHVVNCVRQEVQNCFDGELKYYDLYLQDAGMEDILSVLYDVFDFISEAKELQGKVFIHCSQGVSRSAALVIAYVMWITKQNFDTTKDQLKKQRGVVDPNINFCAQLMTLQRRFHPTSDGFLRIYRMASQSVHSPEYLVPKLCIPNCSARPFGSIELDPRGAFVCHLPARVYIWVGSRHMAQYVIAGRKFAKQLQKYESAPDAIEVHEGHESNEFFSLIASQSHGKKVIAEEQEAFTSDYERFSKNIFQSRSLKERSNSGGSCHLLRRAVSQS